MRPPGCRAVPGATTSTRACLILPPHAMTNPPLHRALATGQSLSSPPDTWGGLVSSLTFSASSRRLLPTARPIMAP